MYRGELYWLLGTPKAPGPDMSMPGWLEKYESPPLPNMTWLKALTNCTSNRVEKRSVMRVIFDKAKSTFQRIRVLEHVRHSSSTPRTITGSGQRGIVHACLIECARSYWNHPVRVSV